MRQSRTVTIVGGGLGGLIAAIECAQAGATVVLHEAGRELGGRARSLDGPYKANYGPHALYADGPLPGWLKAQGALPPLARPPVLGLRFRRDGRTWRRPPSLVSVVTRLARNDGPADVDFRSWASNRVSERAAGTAIGLLSVPTFDFDPGRLSAAMGAKTLRRVTVRGGSVRYVRGGWSALVDALAAAARRHGVEIHTSSVVSELPSPPVIVATARDSARRLLGEALPGAQGTTTAILDVGLSERRERPFVCLDIDDRVWTARYSAADPSLAPVGHDLIQCHAGIRPGEKLEQAVARIEALLDLAFAGWREDERWRRVLRIEDGSGALDLPGVTWRDRAAVDRGDGVFLVGDWVAAPGLLSETTFNSARAATAALRAQSSRAGRRPLTTQHPAPV
jgi:phytoene dehydrogenase-like protein